MVGWLGPAGGFADVCRLTFLPAPHDSKRASRCLARHGVGIRPGVGDYTETLQPLLVLACNAITRLVMHYKACNALQASVTASRSKKTGCTIGIRCEAEMRLILSPGASLGQL